jgi:excisionase family DNA binding protein
MWTSPGIPESNMPSVARDAGEDIDPFRRKVSSLPVTSAMVFNGGVGKRLLNVGEAAGYLGLKVDTVYKKARLRELPFVKVGRALRFDKQALDRLIEQHTIKTID